MPPIANNFFGLTPDNIPETRSLLPQKTEDVEVENESEHAVKTRESDFDKDPTQLYLLLQQKDWDASIARAATNAEEARTWVSRKEETGKLRWRLLPLHAAIIFKAPEHVIEALLGAYPKGAESKDDQGMLPLHLAFRNGSTEGVVNLLLVSYPQSIDVKDRKGRIPLVLAQASTSPNRDAFMRALERGPTYYAVAAAATERAAVTAELRAIFDAKLIEIKNQHQQEVEAIANESNTYVQDLENKIADLEIELAKTQETSQVLVDHVNSLEAQLTSRSDTERFLATKIATLDNTLRDVNRVKEETESSLSNENKNLKLNVEELTAILAEREESLEYLTEKLVRVEAECAETKTMFHATKEKTEFEMHKLEIDAATAIANAAVLEAQLKKKIETEHALASQVSALAGQLAESAAESSSANKSYAEKVENLMNERATLRSTITVLTKKLTFVADELQKVALEQDKIIHAAAEHESGMEAAAATQARLLANAYHHESIVEQVNEERRQILDVLIQQEKEILESAEERRLLKEAINLQVAQTANAVQEREDLVARVNQQKEDVRKIVEEDLALIPKSFSDMDANEMIDEIVKRAEMIKEEMAKDEQAASEKAEEYKREQQEMTENMLREQEEQEDFVEVEEDNVASTLAGVANEDEKREHDVVVDSMSEVEVAMSEVEAVMSEAETAAAMSEVEAVMSEAEAAAAMSEVEAVMSEVEAATSAVEIDAVEAARNETAPPIVSTASI